VYLQVGAEGLFPRPMRASDPQLPEICDRMRLLGRLIAKVLHHIYICVYIYIYTNIYIYIYMCVCVCVCLYIFVYDI